MNYNDIMLTLDSLSTEELKKLKHQIYSTLEKRKQEIVFDKLTKVRDALLELDKVAPYACFIDSSGNQMGIHEIRKFFDTESQARVEMNFPPLSL